MVEKFAVDPQNIFKNQQKPSGNGYLRFVVSGIVQTTTTPLTIPEIVDLAIAKGEYVTACTVKKILMEILYTDLGLKVELVRRGKTKCNGFYINKI